MAGLELTFAIEAPAEQAWAVVRAFGDDSWTGVTIDLDASAGEGVGAVRTVAMPSGPVVERCDRLDDHERVIGYSVVSGNPFPMVDHHSEMRVRAIAAGRSELVWTTTYEVGAGAEAERVQVGLEAFLRYGAQVLVRHVESTA